MKKRYLSDYTLEEQVDPRTGKSRSVPKYRGRTYRFVLQGEKLRRTKLLFAGLTGGSVLALLADAAAPLPAGRKLRAPFARGREREALRAGQN